MLSTSTKAIRTSAAAQAWVWASGLGDSDARKMKTGIEASASPGSVSTPWPKIEESRISGAVSPATRATASRAPVIRPPAAVGSVTRTVVRQRAMPSAWAASFSVPGTSVSTSWAVRATIGSMMIASATERREAALLFLRPTIRP